MTGRRTANRRTLLVRWLLWSCVGEVACQNYPHQHQQHQHQHQQQQQQQQQQPQLRRKEAGLENRPQPRTDSDATYHHSSLWRQLDANDRHDDSPRQRSPPGPPPATDKRDTSHEHHMDAFDDAEDPNDPFVKVIVKYKNDKGRANVELKAHQSKHGPGLKKVGAIGAKLKQSQLEEMENDPDIEYWEEDHIVRPIAQLFDYDIKMIDVVSSVLPVPYPLSESSACNDTDAIKIGIIDSGAYAAHPDLPCLPIDDPNTNCIGQTFDLYPDETWYQPTDLHGTHVFGTISALGIDIGVRGVMEDRKVCYMIARIFGRAQQATVSSVMEAASWLADNGARVINMSLGGDQYSQTSSTFFANLQNDGVLVVAAAGNSGYNGVSTLDYPAAYPSVFSVAAVDETMQHAYYSTFNSQVDISAPGSDILSTAPLDMGYELAIVQGGGTTQPGVFMGQSTVPQVGETIWGVLVECPNYGSSLCPNGGAGNNFICLIERGGSVTFDTKAMNCQKAGGSAAMIWNTEIGVLRGGSLDPSTQVTIPVIGISNWFGEQLITSALGTSVMLTTRDGYAFLDGTSMASPHVTGAAGLIWRYCPACSNSQVSQCLQTTALDLGTPGWDEYYGYGLVQVAPAYQCLITTEKCCEAQSSVQSTSLTLTSAPFITGLGALYPSASPSQAAQRVSRTSDASPGSISMEFLHQSGPQSSAQSVTSPTQTPNDGRSNSVSAMAKEQSNSGDMVLSYTFSLLGAIMTAWYVLL